MKKLLIWSRVSVLSSLSVSCEEIPPESLPASYSISSPKSDMPASESFISKETVEHTSNCEFLVKIYHFPSFWKSLSLTKLTYTPTLSAIYALTPYQTKVSLNADVSENTLLFVSQTTPWKQWNSKKERTETNFQTRDLSSQRNQWTIFICLIPNIFLTN